MRSINAEIELQSLVTIVDSQQEDLQRTCLAKLKESFFGFDKALEIYTRLIELASTKGIIPNKKMFLDDPQLSAEAKTVLATTAVPPCTTEDELTYLFEQLNYYRKARITIELAQGIRNQLKNDTIKPDIVQGAIEQSLLSFKEGDAEVLQLFHSGQQNTSDDVIASILNPKDTAAIIPSGFKNFDSKTRGWRRGNLVVIASHFKGGKSTVKLNILHNQYRHHNLNVCDITIEMNEQEELSRLLSLQSNVAVDKIQNKQYSNQEIDRCNAAWDAHKQHGIDHNCRFTLWPSSSVTISQLELILRPYKFDVIAVDYVNLLTPEAGEAKVNEVQQLSVFYKQLKNMAKRLDCVVLALTQADIATGDIRYAKVAKEDANNVWTWAFGETERTTHCIKINQLAARSHEPFTFYLKEDYGTSSVTDWDGDAPFEEDNGKEESSS